MAVLFGVGSRDGMRERMIRCVLAVGPGKAFGFDTEPVEPWEKLVDNRENAN